jgi:hypothetical protein
MRNERDCEEGMKQLHNSLNKKRNKINQNEKD